MIKIVADVKRAWTATEENITGYAINNQGIIKSLRTKLVWTATAVEEKTNDCKSRPGKL